MASTAAIKYIADAQNGRDVEFMPRLDPYGIMTIVMKHDGRVTIFDRGEAQSIINALSGALADADRQADENNREF